MSKCRNCECTEEGKGTHRSEGSNQRIKYIKEKRKQNR